MRLIALVLFTFLLTPGCKSNNEAANKAPLREAEWTLLGETGESYAPFALQQNAAGDIIHVYHSSAVNDGVRVSPIVVSRVSAQGQKLNANIYKDPVRKLPPQGSGVAQIVYVTRNALLAFDSGDLLVISVTGNLFQLAQSGELIRQYNLGDLGFDKFNLLAHNAQQACFSGRNDTAASLFCMTADGTLVWQQAIPVDENLDRSQAPANLGAFLANGDLLDALATIDGVTLTRHDDNGDTLWSAELALPATRSRTVAGVVALADGVAVAINEGADGNIYSNRVLHVDASGNLTRDASSPGFARLEPYNADSYLRLVKPDTMSGYGRSTADLFRHDATGQALWTRQVALEDMGVEVGNLYKLPISVSQGVISLLQNKQSAKLYSPVVVPIGYHRFIDNLFVSRIGGDGKLIAEDVVGRLNYLVDYEGFIFMFNQYGFYPSLMLDTGTDYVLAGTSYSQGTIEEPTRVPTLASHALSR